jgi:hypothetical protein
MISPTVSHLGSYTVSISLNDGINPAVVFSFIINVIGNHPPAFSSSLVDFLLVI